MFNNIKIDDIVNQDSLDYFKIKKSISIKENLRKIIKIFDFNFNI